MTDEYVTKTGKKLADADIEALADEAERGYEVDQIKPISDERRAELRRLTQEKP